MAKKLRYGNMLIGFAEYQCPYCKLLTDFSENYISIRELSYNSYRFPYKCPKCKNLMIIDSKKRILIKTTNTFQDLKISKETYEEIENKFGVKNEIRR